MISMPPWIILSLWIHYSASDAKASSFLVGINVHFALFAFLDGTEVGYQGCYEDDTDNPEFVYSHKLFNMSYAVCVQHCAGLSYAYAGIQVKSNYLMCSLTTTN